MSLELKLPIGVYDNLEEQLQPVHFVDLYSSNIAIFGNIQSGKTTLLKTIITAIHHMKHDNIDEYIYILDFNNMLARYVELPFVIACFDASNRDNIRRIFMEIERNFGENSDRLGAESFIEGKPGEVPPHVTFIIDGLNGLFSDESLMEYQSKLQRFAREGLSKGMTIIFTANENIGGISRLISSFGNIIALDMSHDKLTELFPSRPDKPISLKGRGILGFGTAAYEFQAFLPYNIEAFGSDDEANMALCSWLRNKGIPVDEWNSRHLKTFKGDLRKEQLPQYLRKGTSCTPDTPDECIYGLKYYSIELAKIRLGSAGTIAIYGKKSFGKSNFLKHIIGVASKSLNPIIAIYDDKRKNMKSKIAGWIDGDIRIESIGNGENVGENISDNVVSEIRKFRRAEPEKFIVYIIGNKAFYRGDSNDNPSPICELKQDIENAGISNSLFVFFDVPRITDYRTRSEFNSVLEHMFIFDDILRFYDGVGADSLIGERRREELREEFGECQLGSGFYFNIVADDLSMIKFIKAD